MKTKWSLIGRSGRKTISTELSKDFALPRLNTKSTIASLIILALSAGYAQAQTEPPEEQKTITFIELDDILIPIVVPPNYSSWLNLTFSSLLGRAASHSEITYWNAEIRSGRHTKSQVRDLISNSMEAKSLRIDAELDLFYRDYVISLFGAYFKRAPSSSELAHYKSRLKGGESLEKIEEVIYLADEHKTLVAEFKSRFTVDQRTKWNNQTLQVSANFKGAVGRDPTTAEVERYLWQCAQTQQMCPGTYDQIVDFSTSSEAIQFENAKNVDVRIANYREYITNLVKVETNFTYPESYLDDLVGRMLAGVPYIEIDREIRYSNEAVAYRSQKAYEEFLEAVSMYDLGRYKAEGVYNGGVMSYSTDPSPALQHLAAQAKAINQRTAQQNAYSPLTAVVEQNSTNTTSVSFAVDETTIPTTSSPALAQAVDQHPNITSLNDSAYPKVIISGTRPPPEIDGVSSFIPSTDLRWGMYPNFNASGDGPGTLHDLIYDPRSPAAFKKAYSIIINGANHERITFVAAGRLGVKDLKRFYQLKEGVRYPDIPDGFVGSFLNFKLEVEGTLTFESHYGSLQHWHSMTPAGVPMTNSQLQNHIVEQLGNWYQQAIETDNWAFVGRMLHTIQDSFSGSHTVRGSSGEIQKFQDYTLQDHDKHGKFDNGHLHELPGVKGAIDKSMRVLLLVMQNASISEMKAEVREIFKLEPGTENKQAGGTAPGVGI